MFDIETIKARNNVRVAGYKAARDGVARSSNPYDNGVDDHLAREWFAGFDAERGDDAGAADIGLAGEAANDNEYDHTIDGRPVGPGALKARKNTAW